ncbi:MAG TPA: lipopolysaccharide kinase InaA family protein [Gemmatimonas sp.]|uniref:lipopolysaccharide kinase InaA family protein n=1 Tax=Gemmatimonas sp. TaxID=1962908 RepID=UPI002ED8C61F
MKLAVPEGIRELPPTVNVAGADITAFPSVRDDLVTLVEAHGSLYEWASEQPQSRALRGRAPVYVATLPTSGMQVVVRHAWHGGLLAPITGDRFRRPSRAPREMWQSLALRGAGVPTTEVLGFVRYDAGPGLVRVDVVTLYVPDTADLGMVLAGLAPDMECDQALDATRALLRTLARHGVVHPDLNVKNVLLRPGQGAALDALMIDVDVVQWDSTRPPDDTMNRNVSRLIRSMTKWRTHFGCDFADRRIAAFVEATRADALALEHH